MEKRLLLFLIVSFLISASFAQEKPNMQALGKAKLEELKNVNSPKIKKWEPASPFKKLAKGERAASSILSGQNQLISSSVTCSDMDFGIWKNPTTGETSLYSVKFNTVGYNNVVSTDLGTLGSLTIHLEWPSTTNYVRILETRTSDYFIVFLHYFEGGTGPAYAKDEIRLINDEGVTIRTFEGTDAFNIHGKLMVLNPIQGGDTYYTIYDENTFEKEFETTISTSLITHHYGSAISFKEMNGKNYFIIPYFEEVPIDNNTLIVRSDNHFILDVYDMDGYNLVKSVKTPVPVVNDGSMFDLWPFFEFGIFSTDLKFDMSDNVFNDDDRMEFIFSICFMNLMSMEEYYVFYVMDEDGNILHQTEDKIAMHYSDNIPVEGYDNQTIFLYDNKGTGLQEYKMFNIESWSVDATFPKTHNGDILSSSANRIKKGDDFEYIIGLSETLVEESGKAYGRIKTYNRNGEETNEVLVDVGFNALVFNPIFEKETLDPYTINDDADREYFYEYQCSADGFTVQQYFGISKANETPILTLSDDEELGNLISNGLINMEGKSKYLYSRYNPEGTKTISFSLYELPLVFEDNTGIADEIAGLQKAAYYDKNTKSIVVSASQVKQVVIYDINGRKVYQGNVGTISTSAWINGIYVVKTIGQGEEIDYAKLLVY